MGISTTISKVISLEDWMQHPPHGPEWVDGKLVGKTELH